MLKVVQKGLGLTKEHPWWFFSICKGLNLVDQWQWIEMDGRVCQLLLFSAILWITKHECQMRKGGIMVLKTFSFFSFIKHKLQNYFWMTVFWIDLIIVFVGQVRPSAGYVLCHLRPEFDSNKRECFWLNYLCSFEITFILYVRK